MEHLKILPKKYNQHYRKITIKFKTGTPFVPEAKELKMEPLMEAKVFSDVAKRNIEYFISVS